MSINMSLVGGQISVSQNSIIGKLRVTEHWQPKSVQGHNSETKIMSLFSLIFFFFIILQSPSLTRASVNDSHITEYMAPLASLIIAE